jgi:3-phenylpropionate/trans-cinnamate dioxygenase ferredoxin component
MAEFITICPVEEIPNGKREVFDINGRWVAIFCVDNRFYAIEDACTHDGNILTEDAKGNPIPLDGFEIECPRHQARFDIRDGKVTNPPAVKDIRWYEVRVNDGQIELKV